MKGKNCNGRTESAQVTRQLSRSDVLPPPLAPPIGVHSSFLSAGVSKISYHRETETSVTECRTLSSATTTKYK